MRAKRGKKREEEVFFFEGKKKKNGLSSKRGLFSFSLNSSYLVVLEAERRRGVPSRVVDHEALPRTLRSKRKS